MHGSALVSIQHITGEALPVLKRVGDEVPAGAVNSDGALVVESIRSSEDSTPARIARLTEAAQNRRPAVSRLLDSVGDRYSKAILAVTALTMVCGPLVFGWPFLGRGGAMYRAFAFLSAAAPCALLMAPLVYVAAIGACARRGVLVRGGVTFDALAECGTVALDKTGTITSGRMKCVSIRRVFGDSDGLNGSSESPGLNGDVRNGGLNGGGLNGGFGGRVPAYVGAMNAEETPESGVAVAERSGEVGDSDPASASANTTDFRSLPARVSRRVGHRGVAGAGRDAPHRARRPRHRGGPATGCASGGCGERLSGRRGMRGGGPGCARRRPRGWRMATGPRRAAPRGWRGSGTPTGRARFCATRARGGR